MVGARKIDNQLKSTKSQYPNPRETPTIKLEKVERHLKIEA